MLFRHILDSWIPKSLEKPPKLDSYDEIDDPDEHVENVDIVLPSPQKRSEVQIICPNPQGEAMTWFKTLPDCYIDSWKKLCNSFTAQYTT